MIRLLRFARGCRSRASTTLTVLALLAAFPLIGAAEARAQGYLFSFTNNVGTGPDPSVGGIDPWLQALVEDVDVIASPGLVKITLTPSFSDPENFVSYVGFSIDPFFSTIQGKPFCTSLASDDYDCAKTSLYSAGINEVGFPGGGVQIGYPVKKSFDLVINAGTGAGGPGSQLGSNESAEFLINGGSGFSAARFAKAFNQIKDLEGDVNSKNGYNAVAKIQGLSCSPTSPSSCSGDSTEIAAGPPQIVDQETEKEPQEDVPSPLPLFGASMALSFSRKVRHRLRHSC